MTTRTARTRTVAILSAGALALTGLASVPLTAGATHGNAELAPSNFEIDDNANLKVDDDEDGKIDWGALAHPDGPEIRATDKPTGQNDDSYKGGTKEDTVCPDETTGSIPNNKSDLLTFHAYTEPGVGDHPGFFNLAWSRVSDPSGTTLMDFEFNQSDENCPQGPNKVRTDGDVLLEYAIVQGGSRATITGRVWDGTANEWGPAQALSDPDARCDGEPCAVGTINNAEIPGAESDGLGTKQARTFGEAQIDLRLIFEPNKCVSFGSAMLKSRSSDSFTSQLKDFIAPIDIDLQNCGNVIIRKETNPDGETGSFDFSTTVQTDPANGGTFSLADGESKNFNNDVLFGTGYTVTETALAAGFQLQSVDCSASSGVTPVITGATVTFDIDQAGDVLDCTYTNKALASLTVVKIAEVAGSFDFTSTTLTPGSFTLSPTGGGADNSASTTFSSLDVGTYDVAETVPDGWNLDDSYCDNGDTPDAVSLGAGDDVTCTFENVRERGAIEITKTRKHAAAGGTDPHAGVTFTVNDSSGAEVAVVQTGTDGKVCVPDLLISQFAGDYSVTETVPDNYVADGDETKSVTVSEGTCAEGAATVSFSNTPLTDVTVSVDSLVEGGTASTISCTDADGNVYNGGTGEGGDGSLTVEDLLPTDPTVTLTCEIVVDP